MMRKDEVEPPAVDLEDRAERIARHLRAFDVPAGPAAPPRRVPRGVLTGLRRLPEREVLRRFLERVSLLLLHLGDTLPRQPPVARIAGDAEIDVAVDGIGVLAVDELLDEADDPVDVLGGFRHLVCEPEPEVAYIVDVPLRRLRGELCARAGSRVVDPVVHVGDVVHECRVVAAATKPVTEPHADDERTSVPDVGPSIDRRPAEVHAHRRRRLRQLLRLSRQRAVEPHAPTLRSSSSRGSAAMTAASSGPRSRPVSARRTALRLPPTAFSSRTMLRASSPPSTSSRNRSRVSRASTST